MVSATEETTRHDRAQLLLVAAVAMAVVIVSFSVVFNGVLFTEQRTAGDADVTASGAELFNHEVRETTAELLIRVNHAGVYNDANGLPNVHDAVAENLTTRYGVLLSESYAASSPASVSVAYDAPNSTVGSRVVQRDDSSASLSVTDRKIGWFTLNVNASETESFDVDVAGQSDSVTYTIERNSRGPGLNITTTGDVPTSTVTCEQTGDRVLFNLADGTAFGDDDCSYPSIGESLSGPYAVGFVGGGDASLRYEIVLNESIAGVPNCSPASATDAPCQSDAVWVAHVVTEYDRARVDYRRSQNVSIYGGGI